MHRVICAVAALGLAAGCESATAPEREVLHWNTTIVGAETFESVSGSASVVAAPASFELDITLAGLLETTYDWELAAGSCAEPGGRIGTDGNYGVLEPVAAGSIAATTVVPAVLAESAPYHVSVFMMVSGEEDDLIRVTVACGDLQRVG